MTQSTGQYSVFVLRAADIPHTSLGEAAREEQERWINVTGK
jgi:hypothetical protein